MDEKKPAGYWIVPPGLRTPLFTGLCIGVATMYSAAGYYWAATAGAPDKTWQDATANLMEMTWGLLTGTIAIGMFLSYPLYAVGKCAGIIGKWLNRGETNEEG